MPNGRDFTPPVDASGGDHTHTAVRIVLGAIPVVGGAAVELLNQVMATPLQGRRDAWCQAVGERLNELGKIEALQGNESFVSTVVHASRVALGEHQKEKLEALCNAIVNASGPHAPEDSIRHMYLKLVEDFTVTHLRLLRFSQNPVEYLKAQGKRFPIDQLMTSFGRGLETAFPELTRQRDLVELVAQDLNNQRLASIGQIYQTTSGDGPWQKKTTARGDEFLKFISDHRAETRVE